MQINDLTKLRRCCIRRASVQRRMTQWWPQRHRLHPKRIIIITITITTTVPFIANVSKRSRAERQPRTVYPKAIWVTAIETDELGRHIFSIHTAYMYSIQHHRTIGEAIHRTKAIKRIQTTEMHPRMCFHWIYYYYLLLFVVILLICHSIQTSSMSLIDCGSVVTAASGPGQMCIDCFSFLFSNFSLTNLTIHTYTHKVFGPILRHIYSWNLRNLYNCNNEEL